MKLLIVLLLVALSATSYGIKCYQCVHSDPPDLGIGKDDACKNSDEKYAQDCTEETKGFEKELKALNVTRLEKTDGKQTLQFSCIASIAWKKNENAAIRGCILKLPDSFEQGSQNGYSTKVRVCNSDRCNNDSASSRPITMPSVIILSVVFFVSKCYF